MKRQIPILLLTVLLLIFSGCSGKDYSMGHMALPSFSQKTVDENLPRIKGLKSKVGLSKVALEWEPVTNKQVAGYRIYRKDRKSDYRLIETLHDRYRSHYIDKNLNPNMGYAYKVTYFTNDGRIARASSAKSIRATRGTLPAPIILKASKGFPSRIKLLWKIHPNKEVNSYIVERLSKDDKAYKTLIGLDDRLSVEYIDKDVQPGQKYKYRVRARTYDNVISPPSRTVEGYSKKLPNAIKWLKATDNRARMIELIWKDTNPIGTIDHYNVYSSPMKDTLYTLLATTRDTKYTDRFESDGSTRYYKVTAVDNDGLESTQGIAPITGQTIGASRGPQINEATVKHNAVFLQWSDPDGKARSYTVVKKYWDGWRARKIKITDFRSTKFTDRKIKPNVQYTYYVISIDKHGIESMPSREIVLSINSQR
jgi:fibronectin type 3 domain-containing protein